MPRMFVKIGMATKMAAKWNYHVVYNVKVVSFVLFRFCKLK